MTCDYVQIGIDEDWDVEPESLDAIRDLPNLLGGVMAGVLGSHLKAINGQIVDRQRPSWRP